MVAAIIIISALCLALGILFGVTLGWKRNLVRIGVTLVLAAILAFIVPGLTEKLVLAIVGIAGVKADSLTDLAAQLLADSSAGQITQLTGVMAGLVKSAAVPVVYVVLFIPVYGISWIVYAVSMKFIRKGTGFFEKKDALTRGIGAFTGVVTGLFIGALLISPVAGLSRSLEALEGTSLMEYIEENETASKTAGVLMAYSNSPVSGVYRSVGAEAVAKAVNNAIANVKNDEGGYTFTQVVESIASNGDVIGDAIKVMSDEGAGLSDMLSVVSGVVTTVTELPCFTAEEVMDITNAVITIAAESSGDPAVQAMLTSVQFTDSDAFRDDMNTVAEIMEDVAALGLDDGSINIKDIEKDDLADIVSKFKSLSNAGSVLPGTINGIISSSAGGQVPELLRTDLTGEEANEAAADLLQAASDAISAMDGNVEVLKGVLEAIRTNPMVNSSALESVLDHFGYKD